MYTKRARTQFSGVRPKRYIYKLTGFVHMGGGWCTDVSACAHSHILRRRGVLNQRWKFWRLCVSERSAVRTSGKSLMIFLLGCWVLITTRVTAYRPCGFECPWFHYTSLLSFAGISCGKWSKVELFNVKGISLRHAHSYYQLRARICISLGVRDFS